MKSYGNAVPLSSYPLEIAYQILLRMSYNDILNYCATNSESRSLCDDNVFWINKLDHDFKPTSQGLALEYVKKYSHSDMKAQFIYKRWMDFEKDEARIYGGRKNWITKGADWIDNITKRVISTDEYSIVTKFVDNNVDIFMYMLDSGYQSNELLMYDLLNSIISQDTLSTLKDLVNRGIFSTTSEYNFTTMYDIAVHYTRLDIMDWLFENGIVPPDTVFDEIDATDNIPVLEWMKKKGVY